MRVFDFGARGPGLVVRKARARAYKGGRLGGELPLFGAEVAFDRGQTRRDGALLWGYAYLADARGLDLQYTPDGLLINQ